MIMKPIELALHIWIELKTRRNGKTFGENLISLLGRSKTIINMVGIAGQA